MNADEGNNLLGRIAATLDEILVWTRATSYPAVARILGEEFGGEDKDASVRAKVYAMSDGKRSTREISAALGGKPSFNTISRMQAKWHKMGLAASVSPQSQRSLTKALFDLGDFGIKVGLPAASSSLSTGDGSGDQREGDGT